MKVATITGRRSAAVVDRPEPHAAGDIVKVQVLVAPACTEWRQYRDGETTETLGHEAAGVVVDAAGSSRVREGDRIVAMPQYGCGRCALCLAGDHIHCRDQRDVIAETGSETGTATYGQFVIKPDWLLLRSPTMSRLFMPRSPAVRSGPRLARWSECTSTSSTPCSCPVAARSGSARS